MGKAKSTVPATKAAGSAPAYLVTQGQPTGTESIGMQDVTVPRLCIVQGLSSIKETMDIKEGHVYTTDGEKIGASAEMYILLHWRSKIWFENMKFAGTIFINPATKELVKVGGEIDAIMQDPARESKGLDCQNYMVVLKKDADTAVKTKVPPTIKILSCKSAAVKYARQLNGKLRENGKRKVPIYGQLVRMTTKLDKFDQGSAHMPQFSYGEWLPETHVKLMEFLFRTAQELSGKDDTFTEHSDEAAPQAGAAPMDTGAPEDSTGF